MLSPRVFEVWELNRYIKRLLEDNRHLQYIWVRGELKNFKRHSSGHLYFSLSDGGNSIKCIMYRDNGSNLSFDPQNGQQVLVLGSVSVYLREGNYQIYVEDMEPLGLGATQLQLEKLKKQLAVEGLFDWQRKRKVIEYPQKVGVVTSLSGAAVKDVLSVINRRYPLLELYIYPAFVQGEQAVKTLQTGIEVLNRIPGMDAIILARGGGSSEDLSAFNDEQLARTIYNSAVPIISAVGHETDFTIADHVADLRAPTPSAAAELVCPDKKELLSQLSNLKRRLTNSYINRISLGKERLNFLVESKLTSGPINKIREEQQRVDFVAFRLIQNYNRQIKECRNKLTILEQTLNTTDPRSILKKGIYSLAISNNGQILGSAFQFKPGEQFELLLGDGKIRAQVVSIAEEENNE